jgi:prefoldin subunit 5
MKYQPGFTDFFMSPVTGRIILPMMPDLQRDYVWVGNRGDRPLPSPIIIDLRLEIIDIRRRLSQTRFILQAASKDFDSSQALNELIPGILRHTDGIVSIALPWVDYVPPILPEKNIWIGNADDQPEPYPRIFLENLPSMLSADPTLLLGAYNLYRGSPNPLTLGIPEIVKTLHITNMADLTQGHLWLGTDSSNPLNYGSNRPVEIIVLPLANMADLPHQKIWRGDISNRPVPVDDLTDLEGRVTITEEDIITINEELGTLLTLPYQNVFIGNEEDVPTPFPRIFMNNLPTMLSIDPTLLLGAYNLYRGSPNPLILGQPEIVKTLHITNMADLTVGHLWLGTNSTDPLNFGANRPVEIVILPLGNMANLPHQKIWRGDSGDRPVPVDDLTDLEARVTINEGDITSILSDIASILSSISSIFSSIATITSSISSILSTLATLASDITVIETTIIDLQSQIDVLVTTTVDLQAQIDTNVASGLDHLADLQLQIDTAIASGNDHLATINTTLTYLQSEIDSINTTISTINTTLTSLQTQINTINTTITSIQSSISTINTTLTTIASQISTINSTITTIQGNITTLFSDITSINTSISTINTTLTTISGQITTINTTITTIQGNITTINSEISTINTQIANITNSFVAGGVVNANNYRIINLPCDPVEDNDAISFCFLWHTLHDEVTVSWS